MKKISVLALFFVMLMACRQSSIPTNAFTPEPVATTPRISQVSIKHARMIYYEIIGSTASELRESMNQLRPKDLYNNNYPVDAYTDWHIAWNWPGYGTDKCDLSAANVTYAINITMPHWTAPANVSSELVSQWEKYIQSLTVHEKGHVDNIVNNYSRVKTAIQSATCSTAEAEAQKALEILRKFDSSYDSATNHGETQGAVFP